MRNLNIACVEQPRQANPRDLDVKLNEADPTFTNIVPLNHPKAFSFKYHNQTNTLSRQAHDVVIIQIYHSIAPQVSQTSPRNSREETQLVEPQNPARSYNLDDRKIPLTTTLRPHIRATYQTGILIHCNALHRDGNGEVTLKHTVREREGREWEEGSRKGTTKEEDPRWVVHGPIGSKGSEGQMPDLSLALSLSRCHIQVVHSHGVRCWLRVL